MDRSRLPGSGRLPLWFPPPPWSIASPARRPAPPPSPPQPLRTRRTGEAIPVSLSDRWYIVGFTGSGKTAFAKQLVKQLRRLYPMTNLYILDSKGGDDFAGWPGLVADQETPAALAKPGGIQVWQPPDDDSADYDGWLGNIKDARLPSIVYIDELSSLGGNGPLSYPPNLARLLKQGRSLRMCVIALTQEAAYIPRQVPKQASHLVHFGLSPDDAHGNAQVANLLSMPYRKGEPGPTPRERFGFLYRRLLPAPAGEVHEYSRYQEFFDE